MCSNYTVTCSFDRLNKKLSLLDHRHIRAYVQGHFNGCGCTIFYSSPIVRKRREGKGKGGKERYSHLNAELQRIARRDKKAFLSDQCKEIEENNRVGKIRDLFKKIRDTKETFHAKMGTIKDRNSMDGPNRSRRY